MLDISSVTGIVAAVGVIVGVVFAILQLRDLVKTRQTDLVMRLFSTFASKEFQDTYVKIMTTDLRDVNDYLKNYGWSPFAQVAMFFEEIGVLTRLNLINIRLAGRLFNLPITMTWEKTKPLVDGIREYFGESKICVYFEYLYNEMQKREQRLQQIQQ